MSDVGLYYYLQRLDYCVMESSTSFVLSVDGFAVSSLLLVLCLRHPTVSAKQPCFQAQTVRHSSSISSSSSSSSSTWVLLCITNAAVQQVGGVQLGAEAVQPRQQEGSGSVCQLLWSEGKVDQEERRTGPCWSGFVIYYSHTLRCMSIHLFVSSCLDSCMLSMSFGIIRYLLVHCTHILGYSSCSFPCNHLG